MLKWGVSDRGGEFETGLEVFRGVLGLGGFF